MENERTKNGPGMQRKYRVFFYQHLVAILLPAILTWVLLQIDNLLDIQIIVLLYLIPVILSTYIGGLTPGILAGIISFLAFDYFFIPPYYALLVHKSSDLITLFIFLVMAVIISQLIGQARNGMQIAKKREMETRRIYELMAALFNCKDCEEISSMLLAHISSSAEYKKVCVKVFEPDDRVTTFEKAASDFEQLNSPDMIIPMQSSHRLEGEIHLWGSNKLLPRENLRLLNAFGNQGAQALERIHLTQAESLSKVLAESDRVKTSILNSVSHELRSPLAAIKASISSLRNGNVELGPDAQQELLATIDEETDQLNALVGNLLDMSRIESGSLRPKIHWESISEIVNSTAKKMRNHLQEHSLVFEFSKSVDLVPCDYVMIGQVFTNLISNSIKYSPVNSSIVIRTMRKGDELWVEIINQSPHIPQDSLPRIFEKFYRITDSDRITGTGLGLSICKGIIEAHGGRIWAENRPEGFTFIFSLPINLSGLKLDIPMEG